MSPLVLAPHMKKVPNKSQKVLDPAASRRACSAAKAMGLLPNPATADGGPAADGGGPAASTESTAPNGLSPRSAGRSHMNNRGIDADENVLSPACCADTGDMGREVLSVERLHGRPDLGL